MKKPWLSAILNGFLPGLGYIYNGRRIAVGLLLFTYSLITLLMVEIDWNEILININELQLTPQLTRMIVAGLLIMAMAIDSYREALDVNSTGRRRRGNAAVGNKASQNSTLPRKTIKK